MKTAKLYLFVLGAVVLAAFCTASAGARRAYPKPTDSLKISLPVGNTTPMLIYLATGLHYFAQQGLAVSINDFQGSNVNPQIASGQADIGLVGTSVPLLDTQQGQPMSIILSMTGGGAAGAILGAPGKIDSLDKLQQLSSCRVGGILSPGTSAYGDSTVLFKALGLKCDRVPITNVAGALGALVSGSVDAVVGNLTQYTSGLAAGQAVPIYDPSVKANRKKLLIAGNFYSESVLYGLTSNLQSKHSAMVKFMKGLGLALKWFNHHTDAQVANALVRFEPFKLLPLADLTKNVTYSRSFNMVGSTNGYLTSTQWANALVGLSTWSVPNFDPNNPLFAYHAAVDMSYYNAGIGKPRGG